MNGDQTATRPSINRPDERPDGWLTPQEAAEALGISVEAIRGRIKRNTLPHRKDQSGAVWVLVVNQTGDQTTAGRDRSTDQHQPDYRPDELVEELRDRIAYLERQVEEEREARRRADTLMARLMDRVPEIEPPPTPETRGSRESDREDEPGMSTPPDRAEPETALQPRSWWRRIFS